MAFMTVLLVAIVGVAVWAYFHTNPRGVALRPLGLYNGAVLLVGGTAAILIGRWLYLDAVVLQGGHSGMPVYLSVMAAGAVYMIVLALGGMVRTFFVFPATARERDD